jgi:homoserine O-succinyltransferase/O-acetyltransferase
MSIILPDGLPASVTLIMEGVSVIESSAFKKSGKKALRIGLINLMPTITDTEIQFARLLTGSGHPVELILITPETCHSKTIPASYVDRFYNKWPSIINLPFDGIIITGAPVEHKPFHQVSYWKEMTGIMEWARQKVPMTFYVGWSAQAAVWAFYSIPRHPLVSKRFGVYQHTVTAPDHPLMADINTTMAVPVSRYMEIKQYYLPQDNSLKVLAESPQAGLCLLDDPANNAVYMFNHLEYDTQTLAAEYDRDIQVGRDTPIPVNYYPGNNPAYLPFNSWIEDGRKLMTNWISQRIKHQAGLAEDLAEDLAA